MNRLQQLRIDERLSVDEVARRADVPVGVVYRLEQGKGTTVERLGRVADVFEVPPSTLLRPAFPEFEGEAA